MEKWKIIIIVVLLGGLAGYGFYQQNATENPPPLDPTKPQPTPMPANSRLSKLQGKAAPAWNFDAKHWVNTPAPVTLAQLKGNVVLLEFWRMGCSHCQEAAPFMENLYEKYSKKGLKMVAIHSPGAPGPENPENDWIQVQQKIKEWGLKYPIAFDEGGNFFKQTYGGDTYPAMLIIDRTGKVEHIQNGHTAEREVELVAALQKALKK
jgi:thiol-disulfide isomerase/thioredoxin